VCDYCKDRCEDNRCQLIIISYLGGQQVIGATQDLPQGAVPVLLFAHFRMIFSFVLLWPTAGVWQIYTLFPVAIVRKVFKFKLGECHVKIWWQEIRRWWEEWNLWHWLAAIVDNFFPFRPNGGSRTSWSECMSSGEHASCWENLAKREVSVGVDLIRGGLLKWVCSLVMRLTT